MNSLNFAITKKSDLETVKQSNKTGSENKKHKKAFFAVKSQKNRKNKRKTSHSRFVDLRCYWGQEIFPPKKDPLKKGGGTKKSVPHLVCRDIWLILQGTLLKLSFRQKFFWVRRKCLWGRHNETLKMNKIGHKGKKFIKRNHKKFHKSFQSKGSQNFINRTKLRKVSQQKVSQKFAKKEKWIQRRNEFFHLPRDGDKKIFGTCCSITKFPFFVWVRGQPYTTRVFSPSPMDSKQVGDIHFLTARG